MGLVVPGPAGRPRILGEAYFAQIVRWVTWLIALLGTLSSVPKALQPIAVVMLVLTGLYLTIHTLWAPVFRFWFPREWMDGPPGKRLEDARIWAVVDVASAALVIGLTGGWDSSFYHYGLSSVLIPSLVFGYRGALISAGSFVALYSLAVAYGTPGGIARVQGGILGFADQFLVLLIDPFLAAFFVAYLSSILKRLRHEEARTRQALREAQVLNEVGQAALGNTTSPALLLARATNAIQRGLDYPSFAVFLRNEQGQPRPVEGYGPLLGGDGRIAGLARGRASLKLDSRELGYVEAAAALDRLDAQLLETLAGQITLGLATADLLRQREALAAQAERARLAREIHDGIAQALFMLALNLETCADLAASDRTDLLLPERLRDLMRFAKQTLWETRQYMFELKPLLSGEHKLAPSIENQLKEFRSVTGLPVELRVEGEEGSLPVPVRAALYRLLQEALANAFKHAAARSIQVCLRFAPDHTELEVQDAGRGFTLPKADAPPSGHGLGNMRARAEELGGTLQIDSQPGRGTRLRACVPHQPAPIGPDHVAGGAP